MKKCLILMILFLFLGITTAKADEQQTGITFIYINGSNNLAYNNRLKFKTAFVENVKKLHPQIKKRFEQDELINKIVLQNGNYRINQEPIAFYWGDKSLKVVETLDRDLKSASKYSPRIAHQARSIFAHCLHDAVWVQKPQNMANVLDELHKVVNNEINHSAGDHANEADHEIGFDLQAYRHAYEDGRQCNHDGASAVIDVGGTLILGK
jgi:hypothetical protein